jgi:hypothetical protein
VIEPEIRHHLFELSIAGDCASNTGGLQFAHHLASRERDLPEGHTVLARYFFSAIRISLYQSPLLLTFDELREQLALILLEDAVTIEELLHAGIVDPFRMELLVYPVVEACRANPLHVAWASAKGEAVQCMNDLLVRGELAMIEPCLRAQRRRARRKGKRAERN